MSENDERWNVDERKIREEQEALKKQMNFVYVGHGPRATGFLAKDFKRKPGLYARCTQCGYYMPLDAKGTRICICGNLQPRRHELQERSRRVRSGDLQSHEAVSALLPPL